VLKAYSDDEYDFGIDASTVASLTGLTIEESKQLIKLLSKDKKGLMYLRFLPTLLTSLSSVRVNALTLLSTVVCLADASQQMLETRAGAIFDLFDFDGTAQINQDETVCFLSPPDLTLALSSFFTPLSDNPPHVCQYSHVLYFKKS
jgi:hypothetical protein